ncbi:hypothetical protein Br6_02299 [Rhodococcus sp. Br-6]|nr:hypothetical protein Br6_02299 [Rhodococcus sp. Br-6]
MSLTVPDDIPRFRYMRYVRPPAKATGTQRDAQPLFPIQPSTRKMRVGIDVQTLPEPTAELLRVIGRDEEVDPILLVQNDAGDPTGWLRVLGSREWYEFTFTTVEDAPKFADASTVGISGHRDGERWLWTSGNFFSIYAQLDKAARKAYSDDDGLTLADRHRASALAAAAGAVGVDVIVTAAPTALRDDVADNDSVLSVTPDQLLPLFGHYLRSTGNHVLESAKGGLQGGGTFVRKYNATSVADLYLAGIDASVPHLTAIRLMATVGRDADLVESMAAIALRLSRAARAVDNLLAALSNGSSSAMQRSDTAETTAEAFDRILLYLCAAMDRYARVTQTLFDTSLNPDKQRGSLTSTVELRSVIEKFEPTDTAELEALGAYARIIGQLRNRIHAIPLDTQHQLSRGYGSSTTVAVTLDGLAEFDPGSTPLNQDQLDRLGVWNAQSSNPFEPRSYAADLATLATTLFKETLRYVEEFSRFLIRNKTLATITTAQHPVLGCWADDPRPMPDPTGNEVLYREMLGWADFG